MIPSTAVRYALEPDKITCDATLVHCQLKIEDFPLAGRKVVVGFGYTGLELGLDEFRKHKIEPWQTARQESFECGRFTSTTDLKLLAEDFGLAASFEHTSTGHETGKAVPCGYENGLFALSERIERVTDFKIEYPLELDPGETSVEKQLEGLDSNWLANLGLYYNWLGFLKSNGVGLFEQGRIAAELPSSFYVDFRNGLGNLGRNSPVFLVFFVEAERMGNVAIGVALLGVAAASLIISAFNFWAFRRIRRQTGK